MRSFAKERFGGKKQMHVKTMAVRTMFIAAALSALATSASALVLGIDPQIYINRTIDSPTLTVRYSGTSAALVELRVNGTSFGTRTVSEAKDSGETNFTLALGDLRPGDNDVEIRLFDRTGKLVAKDHTNVSTMPAQTGPVFVSTPKTGDTVRGPVSMKLGFDRDLKDCYVSFFIDGVFKNMTNVPPYEYMWDSERESNGWHELEAWAIDDSSETHKTAKVRVFVNNPSGATHRLGIKATPTFVPTTNLAVVTTALHPVANKTIKAVKSFHPTADLKPLPPTAPSIRSDEVLGAPSGAKAIKPAAGIAMGPHNMFPSGARNAAPKQVIEISRHVDRVAMKTVASQISSVVPKVEAAASLIRISQGSRLNLPNLSAFAISIDSALVDFHGVLPRVDEGVPMTPLRFLLERKGGLVGWDNHSKVMSAKTAKTSLSLHVGTSVATVNHGHVKLERASYIDRGRTVVPVSFMEKALDVNIDFDQKSKHMLITSQH